MQITLSQGVLNGRKESSIPSGNIFYSFLGIPYAEPPVGFLRFQAPQPHRGWNGTFDATKPSSACIQKLPLKSDFIGSEDCLYINVHVPQNPYEIKYLKPVMVFIHGGGFSSGFGDMYSAEYLMEYDVILVTFNYRLHVFGFLNLGLPECPGNVGLKDQVMALKWVKENIRSFGGDNSNITVFGESAGAASIHYLMMSPMGKGLFNRAILQSGHGYCSWAFCPDPFTIGFKIGSLLGYNGNSLNRKELLEFLLEVPATELTRAQLKLSARMNSTLFYTTIPFAPSVECGIEFDQALLPDKPEVLLKNMTPIPLLTGLNNLEGLIFLNANSAKKVELDLSSDCMQLVPPEWRKIPGVLPNIANKIQKFYFPHIKTLSKKCLEQIVDMLTDTGFSKYFYETPNIILKHDPNIPVYIYRFSYDGKMNFLKTMCLIAFEDVKIPGACHGEDLFYLFRMKNNLIDMTYSYDDEKNMIDTFCSLWTNFAKYGTPSPAFFNIKWEPMSASKPCYLNISEKIEMKTGLIDEERQKFWNSLIAEVESIKNSIKHKF